MHHTVQQLINGLVSSHRQEGTFPCRKTFRRYSRALCASAQLLGAQGSVGQAGHCSQKLFHNTREKSVESENKCEGKGRTKNNCSSVGSWTQTGPEGRTVPQSTQLSQGHPQLSLGPAAPAGEEQSGLEAKKLPDVSCGSVQIIFGPCREVSGPKDALFLCTLCGCRTCLDGVCWHWQRGPGT